MSGGSAAGTPIGGIDACGRPNPAAAIGRFGAWVGQPNPGLGTLGHVGGAAPKSDSIIDVLLMSGTT